MNKKRVVGLVFIVLAIGITVSNLNINGAVIGKSVSNSLSLIAAVFLVIGLILMSYRERNYAQEILDQRRFVDDTRELKRVARKMGYNLVGGHKEGTKVYSGDQVLTVIPHHRKIEKKGTVYSILEALATEKSSFRKRHYAQT